MINLQNMKKSVNHCNQLYFLIEDSEEERVMYSSSDNIKFPSYSQVNDVIEKIFKSTRSKYQDGLEASLKGSDFTFYLVQLMYCNCHQVNFKRGGSYIDFPDWIKNKKT